MPTELAPAEYRMLHPISGLHHHLLGWYDQAKRAMPWRESRDPYAIWLSETMLQQTQVETVKPYYRKFLERFPTVADLAAADLQEVLSLWAGLGYYRRAKHLHLAAKMLVEKFGGKIPREFEAILSLPGVGRYTAGAVGSIAFGLPVPVVDGNVMRVIARLTGYDRDIADPKNAGFFWDVMGQVLEGATTSSQKSAAGSQKRGKSIPLPRYGDINQAVMELGATVCTPPPGVPACLLCPVRRWCRAFAEGRVMELPVKRKKGQTPVVRGVAVVAIRNVERGTINDEMGREVLLMKRPMGGVWEGMWEFPVVAEEAEIEGLVGGLGKRVEQCGELRHQLTHRRMEFEVVRVEIEGENSKPKTKNAKAHASARAEEGDIVLPACATAGGKRYVEHAWVRWPLQKGGGLPLAKIVWKVAEAAEGPRE